MAKKKKAKKKKSPARATAPEKKETSESSSGRVTVPGLSAAPHTVRPPQDRPQGVRRIVIVSDGTGETAVQMIKAALVQFNQPDVAFTRYKNIRTRDQIQAVCDEVAANETLMVYTLVSPRLRAYVRKTAGSRKIPAVDLLGPLLIGLAQYFQFKPKLIAGLLRDVNESYFKRIDAMEYTIAHDDGRDLTGLERADVVILGISRTSKTPLSMYLSHQGWRVANIPIIKGFRLPDEIHQVDPRKVVCLTINPEVLTTIRRSRLQRLGQNRGGEYADMQKVVDEIEYADELYRKNRRWAVFDVTGKALEETASEIIRLLTSRGLAPPTALSGLIPGVLPKTPESGMKS